MYKNCRHCLQAGGTGWSHGRDVGFPLLSCCSFGWHNIGKVGVSLGKKVAFLSVGFELLPV